MVVHADGSRCDSPPLEFDVGRSIFCLHGLRVVETTTEELQ